MWDLPLSNLGSGWSLLKRAQPSQTRKEADASMRRFPLKHNYWSLLNPLATGAFTNYEPFAFYTLNMDINSHGDCVYQNSEKWMSFNVKITPQLAKCFIRLFFWSTFIGDLLQM